MSRPYPVHEAKAKLSEILRRVKQGKSVTISERGREVARVVPLDQSRDLATRLDQLQQDGVVVPGAGTAATIRPLIRRRGALRRFLQSRT